MKDRFQRCEYDRTTPQGGTERKIYVIRGYGPGWECVDALLDCYRYPENIAGAPESVRVCEEIERRKTEVRYISLEVFDGDISLVKLDNFGVDYNNYTAEELIANPVLLPDGDVEGFKRVYAKYFEEE